MLFLSNLPRTFRSNSYISSDAVPYRIQIFSKPLPSGCHNIMKRLTILRRSQRWTIHFLNSLSAAYDLTPDASNSWISLLLIDTLLWILMLWKACTFYHWGTSKLGRILTRDGTHSSLSGSLESKLTPA